MHQHPLFVQHLQARCTEDISAFLDCVESIARVATPPCHIDLQCMPHTSWQHVAKSFWYNSSAFALGRKQQIPPHSQCCVAFWSLRAPSFTRTYNIMGHMISNYTLATHQHTPKHTHTNYTNCHNQLHMHTYSTKYSIVNIDLTAHDTNTTGTPYVNKKRGSSPWTRCEHLSSSLQPRKEHRSVQGALVEVDHGPPCCKSG